MKAHTKHLVKRWLTAAASMTIALSAFADTAFIGRAADDIAEEDIAITGTENDLAELERRQRELDEKIQATEGDIAAEEEHKKAISEQILVVEDTLHALAASVTELNEDISVRDSDIEAKQQDAEKTKNDIVLGIDDLKQRMRIMYIAGGNSYTDILVGASDFYDMLMKMELIKRVADHDNAEIDCLIALKAQYEQEAAELDLQKAALEDNLAELQQRRKQQQAQMEKLKGLYQESESSITMLNTDKENYEANREQIEKEHQEFENQLAELFAKQQAIAAAKKEEEAQAAAEAEAKKAAKKAKQEAAAKKAAEEAAKAAEDLPDIIVDDGAQEENTNIVIEGGDDEEPTENTADNNVEDFEDTSYFEDNEDEQPQDVDNSSDAQTSSGGGSDPNEAYGYSPKSRFTWPVPGYYNISYGIGWRWGAYHQGIDIWSEGIRGHDIIAADDGTVILVSNTCTHDYGKNGSCGCGGGYGNYCIIDHGDGWWTLYGHSEGITVSEGQEVKKGDVIGTVGSTGYSTGPHLHFEVRINNEPQNPEDYV